MKLTPKTLRIVGALLLLGAFVSFFENDLTIWPDVAQQYRIDFSNTLLVFASLSGLAALLFTTKLKQLSLALIAIASIPLVIANPLAYQLSSRADPNPWSNGPFLLLMLVAVSVNGWMIYDVYTSTFGGAKKKLPPSLYRKYALVGAALAALDIWLITSFNNVRNEDGFGLAVALSGGSLVLVPSLMLAIINLLFVVWLMNGVATAQSTAKSPKRKKSNAKH